MTVNLNTDVGTEMWSIAAWGDVRECPDIDSIMEEVREALELGCRTIIIERKEFAPNPVNQ